MVQTNGTLASPTNFFNANAAAIAAAANTNNFAPTNSPFLLNRTNHTGTQAESTINNLVADLAAKQATNSNLTKFSTNDLSGGTNINASALASGTVPSARLSLIASDIPTLTLSKISDAGTAAGSNATVFASAVNLNSVSNSVVPTNSPTDGHVISATGAKTKWVAQTGGSSTNEAGMFSKRQTLTFNNGATAGINPDQRITIADFTNGNLVCWAHVKGTNLTDNTIVDVPLHIDCLAQTTRKPKICQFQGTLSSASAFVLTAAHDGASHIKLYIQLPSTNWDMTIELYDGITAPMSVTETNGDVLAYFGTRTVIDGLIAGDSFVASMMSLMDCNGNSAQFIGEFLGSCIDTDGIELSSSGYRGHLHFGEGAAGTINAQTAGDTVALGFNATADAGNIFIWNGDSSDPSNSTNSTAGRFQVVAPTDVMLVTHEIQMFFPSGDRTNVTFTSDGEGTLTIHDKSGAPLQVAADSFAGDGSALTNVTAINVASSNTNTYALAATGWTNILSVNSQVYLTAATTAAVKETNGNAIVTIGAISQTMTFNLHPGQWIIGTGIAGIAQP